MAKRGTAFALVLGSSALAFPASAQVSRSFSGGLDLGVLTDSNTARSSDAVAALRGIEQRDTVFTPRASLDFNRPIGRNAMYLRGNVGYRIYQQNTNLNKEVADVQGGLTTRIGRCEGVLGGAFARRQRDVDDLAIPDPRVIQDTRSFQLQQTCGLSTSFGIQLGVGQLWGETRGGGVNNLDYDNKTMNAGVVFRRSTLGEASVFYSRSETDLSNNTALATARGYEVNSVGFRYSRKLGSRLTGSASVAQTTVDSKGVASGSSDFSGVNYDLQVNYQPTSRLGFDLSFDRVIKPSVQAGRLYSIRKGLTASASYKLGSRLTYTLGGSVHENVSQGEVLPGTVGLRDSRSTVLRTALRFQQSDRLSFVLNASHTKYDTNDPMFDYTSTRVGLTTSLGF